MNRVKLNIKMTNAGHLIKRGIEPRVTYFPLYPPLEMLMKLSLVYLLFYVFISNALDTVEEDPLETLNCEYCVDNLVKVMGILYHM